MQLPVYEMSQKSLDSGSGMSIAWDEAGRIGAKAVGALNKRRFLRKRLGPEEQAAVARIFARAILNNSAVQCSMLWGIGTKTTCGHPEETALRQLTRFEAAVRNEWDPGLKFSIVFADVHARINQIPEETIVAYFKGIQALLTDFVLLKTQLVLLSDLWSDMNKSMVDIAIIKKKLSLDKLMYSYPIILRNAEKRYHGDDLTEGALTYIAARLIDQEVLTRCYPDSLHLTYNNPEATSFLQPNTPVLYVWSLTKWVNRAPWFSENEEYL